MITQREKSYIEILTLLLPFIRNVETSKGDVAKTLHGLHYEIEMIHNIPPLLGYNDYSVRDESWLSCQALSYENNVTDGPFHGLIVKNIEILRSGLAVWKQGLITRGP